ncbi:MAG TPA: hypothetical protein VK255_02500 [Patescibacteria group bacterium]|nr:hypothetical protein [Patescibacteria group bacterium]
MNPYFLLAIIIFIPLFIIYLIFDLATTSPSAFMDKWVNKTKFLWMPFYALQRLIREVILKK